MPETTNNNWPTPETTSKFGQQQKPVQDIPHIHLSPIHWSNYASDFFFPVILYH